jgi:hypothetical protein
MHRLFGIFKILGSFIDDLRARGRRCMWCVHWEDEDGEWPVHRCLLKGKMTNATDWCRQFERETP